MHVTDDLSETLDPQDLPTTCESQCTALIHDALALSTLVNFGLGSAACAYTKALALDYRNGVGGRRAIAVRGRRAGAVTRASNERAENVRKLHRCCKATVCWKRVRTMWV